MFPNNGRRNSNLLCQRTAGMKSMLVQFLDNGTVNIVEAGLPTFDPPSTAFLPNRNSLIHFYTVN
jgi:hypothetical protein